MPSDNDQILRAIREAGCAPQNAIFLLAFAYGTSGGSFKATFNGAQTDDISFPPSAADLKAALETLITVGADGVNVQGILGGPYEIEMVGANAAQVVPDLLIDGSSLVPVQTPSPETIQQGDPNSYLADATALWEANADAENDNLRFLQTKLGIIELRMGKASANVDVLTGHANRVEVKQSQEFAAIQDLWQKCYDSIQLARRQLTQSARGTYGGVMKARTPNGLPYGQLQCDRTGNLT